MSRAEGVRDGHRAGRPVIAVERKRVHEEVRENERDVIGPDAGIDGAIPALDAEAAKQILEPSSHVLELGTEVDAGGCAHHNEYQRGMRERGTNGWRADL